MLKLVKGSFVTVIAAVGVIALNSNVAAQAIKANVPSGNAYLSAEEIETRLSDSTFRFDMVLPRPARGEITYLKNGAADANTDSGWSGSGAWSTRAPDLYCVHITTPRCRRITVDASGTLHFFDEHTGAKTGTASKIR